MGADDLATQGDRASATMILIQLSRDNSVLARYGNTHNSSSRCGRLVVLPETPLIFTFTGGTVSVSILDPEM